MLGEDSHNITRRGTPGYSAPSWFVESGGHPDNRSRIFSDAAEEDGHIGPSDPPLVIRVVFCRIFEGNSEKRFRGCRDVFSLLLRVVKLPGTDVSLLKILCLCGLHLLRKTRKILLDKNPCRFDDPFGGSEIIFHPHLRDVRVAILKSQDVFDITAPPLVDRLVVVSNDAQPRPE